MTKAESTTSNETMARILAAAGTLMSLYGFRRLTMDNVGRELGISKRTIYRYFSRKQELIEAVVSMEFIRRKEALREARLYSTNAIQQMFLSWGIVHELKFSFTSEFGAQLRHAYPHAYSVIKEFQTVFLRDYFKHNIETGITEGLYRDTIKPEVISLYVTQVILSAEITSVLAMAGWASWKQTISSSPITDML